jgi:hypothetical protein
MDDLPIAPPPVDRTPWRRRHHPWRTFGTFRDWTLEWANDLPDGRWGLTLHGEKKVRIADHLDEAERRCTIAHETQHILRGPVDDGRHAYLREELEINRRIARTLAPSIHRISHAMAWHHADHEATRPWRPDCRR